MTAPGVQMFARYAYPPNELGYCGPDDASVLLDRDSPAAAEQIAQHARQFEGAWPYLEIIAAAAGIDDPLDARVVEAYWVGNELLDAVDREALVAELQQRFVGQAGASWVPGNPHHGFHVFAVYPWVGLLARDAANGVALTVLDQCRIRWGEVVAVDGKRVSVRSRPLVVRDSQLELGELRTETVTSLLSTESPGDLVAMHWGWVCDVLRTAQVAELEFRTADQLWRTNAALRPVASRG